MRLNKETIKAQGLVPTLQSLGIPSSFTNFTALKKFLDSPVMSELEQDGFDIAECIKLLAKDTGVQELEALIAYYAPQYKEIRTQAIAAGFTPNIIIKLAAKLDILIKLFKSQPTDFSFFKSAGFKPNEVAEILKVKEVEKTLVTLTLMLKNKNINAWVKALAERKDLIYKVTESRHSFARMNFLANTLKNEVVRNALNAGSVFKIFIDKLSICYLNSLPVIADVTALNAWLKDSMPQEIFETEEDGKPKRRKYATGLSDVAGPDTSEPYGSQVQTNLATAAVKVDSPDQEDDYEAEPLTKETLLPSPTLGQLSFYTFFNPPSVCTTNKDYITTLLAEELKSCNNMLKDLVPLPLLVHCKSLTELYHNLRTVVEAQKKSCEFTHLLFATFDGETDTHKIELQNHLTHINNTVKNIFNFATESFATDNPELKEQTNMVVKILLNFNESNLKVIDEINKHLALFPPSERPGFSP